VFGVVMLDVGADCRKEKADCRKEKADCKKIQ